MNIRKKIAEWIYPDLSMEWGTPYYDAGYRDGYNAHKKEIADSLNGNAAKKKIAPSLNENGLLTFYEKPKRTTPTKKKTK